jgi:epoxide hydrolase 4
MINWYRALFRQDLPIPAAGAIDILMLLIEGRDPFGTPALVERSAALGRNVTIEHWPEATHWALHDEPERLALRLKNFLDRDHDGLQGG